MSATDELRKLLDARGAEWSSIGGDTAWFDSRGWTVEAVADDVDGTMLHVMTLMTPAQAVEATLGRGTCKDVSDSAKHADVAFECSECGCWVAYDEFWDTRIYVCVDGQPMHIIPHFCPNCGREVVE